MAGPWEQFQSTDQGPWTQFAPVAPPPAEKPLIPSAVTDVFHQFADVPIGFQKGILQGIRMVSDVFGANNAFSRSVKQNEEALAGLMSAQSKNDQQEIARILKEAEDKGILDQVKAGVKAFTVAPVDTLTSALGTAAPAIVAALGANILGAGALLTTGVSMATGAVMGAGTIKGTIYEETKQALLDAGVSEADAEQRAIKAQEYGGKNLDQILTGAVIGGVAARGPLEKGAVRALASRISKNVAAREAAESVSEKAAKGAVSGRLRKGVEEALPEALQGTQEKVASNIAQQREGLDVPTFRGAVSAGTLEGLAGFGLGAATGKGKEPAAPQIPPAPPVAPSVETTAATTPPAPPVAPPVTKAPPSPPPAPPVAPVAETPAVETPAVETPVTPGVAETPTAPTAETTAPQAPPAMAAPEGTKFTFETAKGSQYFVFEDGTTQRNKAPRPEHPGDQGVKERTARTIYVDGDASRLSAAGVTGMEGARVIIDDDGTASLVWKNPQTGQLGSAPISSKIKFYTEPAIGRSPLELWNKTEVAGREGYSGMHAGNKIVKLSPIETNKTTPTNTETTSGTQATTTTETPATTTETTPPVEQPKVEAPTPPAQPPSAPKVEAAAPSAFKSKIVSRQPAPDGMEVHVFTTTDGYGTGLFDADAGQYVNGSVTRFAGTDTLPKAEARAAEMLRKATPAESTVDVAQQVKDLREQQTKLLTKSGKVPAPRSPARQKYDVLERQIAELENRQLAVRTQKPRKPPKTIMGSPMLAGIFNQIGGLHTSLLPEFSTRFFTKKLDKKGRPIIMVRNPMIPGYGTLFNKNGKFDFGEIAEHLEAEGYLEPGSLERDYKDAGERAKELVKRALNGEEVLPIDEQIAKDNFEREASERQKALDRQEENRMIATGELQLEPEFDWTNEQFEQNLGLDREFETDLEMYNLEPKDLEFLSDEELESELTDAEREQAQARRTRKAAEDAARQKDEGAAPGEAEEILTRPTAEGLKAKQEAAEKAAAEEKKAKAAEQERLRKEQQAKEEKARADETVKDFELGKSAEEQMTGMGDLFAEPPVREARQGTPKQLEAADGHAKSTGGTVVYQDGDIALVRGFSVLNGQPVYVVTNGDYRSRVDIEGYAGNLVTPEQKANLVKVKQDLEAEDKAKFDKSPSIKFTDGLATSRNISPEIAGVVRGWKDLLGLKVNLYITTVGDAIADRNRFNGPHRAVGSAGINDREAGVVRKLPNGDYYIAFKISTSKTKMLEVIAHELGHIHELEVFNRADEATRQQILDEHSKWLKRQTGKTAREFVTALRAKTAGKTTRIGEGMMASEMDSRYWKAFTEWYADQVSRWAVTSEKPISVVEKFFNRLAQALKSFYSKLKNAGYLPNETFVQYLNKTHQPSDHVITPDEGIAGQMLGEVEPTGTPGQQALATINRMGMGVKPPEPGRIEKAKAYLKEAGENPAGTKESAKKAFAKFTDWFETISMSGDAAFNNTITRSVIKDLKQNQEVLGKLLEIGQSQAVNADNVVSRGLIEGTVEYDEETKKHQSVKKDENFTALSKKLEELSEKYGLTKQQMERIAHTYLVAKRLPGIIKRNEELDAEIKAEEATAKPDRKSIDKWKSLKVFVSPQQEQMIEPGLSLLKDIPELSQIPEMMNAIRKNHIKFMVDSGLWSAEYAQAMWDNIDWVPFYREEQLAADAGPPEFIRGLQVKSKEFQMKGSEAAVNDVFENMMLWSQYAMNRAIRADKARRMIDVAKDIDIGDRKMAVRVTEEKRGMNIVRVFRDGKQELWDMADPMFVPAFSAIQNVSIPMFKWAAKVADVLRNSVVLYPMFSVAQVPQDSFAAMYTSGLKPQYALRIPILTVKEFIKTLNKTSATHNQLVKYGVVGARTFDADVMRKDAEIYAGLKPPKGGWNKTKDFLEHIAMSADNAVRQAVYEAAQQQGVSKAEALEKAFEIFNVRRRGTSKALNLAGQTIPFFYAYLAAQRVVYRTITGTGTSPTERKAALQTLAATSAAVFTLSMLYAMMVGDDKNYADTPAAVRDRTLTVPGSGGVRIPLRADFFLFPKIIAEHTYLLLTDKGYEDGAKFRRSMRDNLVNAVASPTPLPQVVKPQLEVAINYDFFTGKPVIGTFEKQKDLERQFNDSTSELSKLLGKTGLVSPIAVDHLIRGMFGSAGGLVMYASNFFTSDPDVPRPELSVNEMLAALPGTSGFLKRPQESALKNDFYVLRDEVEKAVNTFNDIKTRSPQGMEAFLADEKQMARLMLGKPVDKINRELSKIRRQMTIITNMPESQMSASEKADNIRQLRELEREYLKSVDVKALREMAKI